MNDTIAAIATPPGRGGVGIIRVSGSKSRDICQQLIGQIPPPRFARYTGFIDHDGNKIDEGLAIFFNNPASFTGEDVLELHGHGGPVIMDMLLRRIVALGARLARAGEFSERAFLNNKMDLLQVEAVAQLISASSEQAARAAMRSLQGEFSNKIRQLVEALIRLRLYVEAAIDFPEEEINFLADAHVQESLNSLMAQLNTIHMQARQGHLLSEGVDIVIAGRPNAGKSTLLNKLTGEDTAIVTPVAGTTRDIVKAQISLDGVLLNVIDTAGVRNTDDIVEQAGIERAKRAAGLADLILLVVDGFSDEAELLAEYRGYSKVILVHNKIDLHGLDARILRRDDCIEVYISANTGAGLEILKQEIKNMIGCSYIQDGGVLLARRRHLDALERAQYAIKNGKQQLVENAAGELLAEELRLAQQFLSEITGDFTSDDLLGRIFSEFCIGK